MQARYPAQYRYASRGEARVETRNWTVTVQSCAGLSRRSAAKPQSRADEAA